jgi:uncharacterized RDD family membrane protein YckC
MQNPPPPPPPSGGTPPPPPPPPYGQPAMPPGGQPPMMQPGGAMTVPGNLASPWLRIVGGLVDVVILVIINAIIGAVLQKAQVLASLINLIIDLGYFGYFLSSRGQTIGMMLFGFKVRDQATGQYPTVGKAVLRGFIWNVEVGLTVCLVGIIGWAWQLWDPQRQAIHDKVAGTIVTVN